MIGKSVEEILTKFFRYSYWIMASLSSSVIMRITWW